MKEKLAKVLRQRIPYLFNKDERINSETEKTIEEIKEEVGQVER